MNESGDVEIRVRHAGIHTTVFHVKAEQQLGGFRTQDVDNTAGSNNNTIVAFLLQTYFIGAAAGWNVAQVNIHRLASLGLDVETTHITAINNEVHSLIKVSAIVGNRGANGHRAAQGGLLDGADDSAAEVEGAEAAGIGYVVLDGQSNVIFEITSAYKPFICVDGSADSLDGIGAVRQTGRQCQRSTHPPIIIIGQVPFRKHFNRFHLLVLVIIDAAANVEGASRSREVHHTNIDGQHERAVGLTLKLGFVCINNQIIGCQGQRIFRWFCLRRLLYAYHSLLIKVKGIWRNGGIVSLNIRVEHRKQEVAVIVAIPAPVHMVKTVFAVSVDNKRMSIPQRRTTINHRTPLLQLLIDEIIPFGSTIEVSYGVVHILVVAEIFAEGRGNIITIGITAIGRIVHLYGLTAKQHELCHSLLLCLGGTIVILVEHVVPVNSGLGNGTHRKAIGFCRIGRNDGSGHLGVLIVIHHLCHRRSHAARIRTLVV